MPVRVRPSLSLRLAQTILSKRRKKEVPATRRITASSRLQARTQTLEVSALSECPKLSNGSPAAPATPLEPIADPARLLYRTAIFDSIANVECTMQVYDILLSAQTQAPQNSKNVSDYSVQQTRAYRSKLEFRRDKLLEQLKGVPVDASLVNKMMEVAFTGSKDQVLEAVEHYGDVIVKANLLLQRGGYGQREMANLKVLWDCMCILLKRHSAFDSREEVLSTEA